MGGAAGLGPHASEVDVDCILSNLFLGVRPDAGKRWLSLFVAPICQMGFDACFIQIPNVLWPDSISASYLSSGIS